jgi:hypothetical protein
MRPVFYPDGFHHDRLGYPKIMTVLTAALRLRHEADSEDHTIEISMEFAEGPLRSSSGATFGPGDADDWPNQFVFHAMMNQSRAQQRN